MGNGSVLDRRRRVVAFARDRLFQRVADFKILQFMFGYEVFNLFCDRSFVDEFRDIDPFASAPGAATAAIVSPAELRRFSPAILKRLLTGITHNAYHLVSFRIKHLCFGILREQESLKEK